MATRGVVLQLLTLKGSANGGSAYGLRAINGSRVLLEQVTSPKPVRGRRAPHAVRRRRVSPAVHGSTGGHGTFANVRRSRLSRR